MTFHSSPLISKGLHSESAAPLMKQLPISRRSSTSLYIFISHPYAVQLHEPRNVLRAERINLPALAERIQHPAQLLPEGGGHAEHQPPVPPTCAEFLSLQLRQHS